MCCLAAYGSLPSAVGCIACVYDSALFPSCPAICFVDMIVTVVDSNLKMGLPDAYA